MKKLPFAIVSLFLILPLAAAADVTGTEQAGPPAPEKPRRNISDLIPRQPGDDELQLFDPKNTLSDTEKLRSDAMAWYMAGQLKEGRNDFDGAMDAYRKAIEVSPTELPAYQSLVTIAFAQPRRHEEAKDYALQAAEKASGGVSLVRGLAALFARGNESSEAVELLEQTLDLSTTESSRVDQLLLHRDLGLFSRLSGNAEKSYENYRTVFQALQEEDSPLTEKQREEVLGDAGATYEEMGKVFLDAKQPDLAVAAFEEAAKFNKNRPAVHSFNLATVYKETGEPEKALDSLQEYFNAQLQTKGREAYQLLKELLEETGKSEQLLPRLEELHAEDKHNDALSYFLADQYQEQDHLDEAEALFKETLKESDDPRGLVGLASVYRQKQDAEPLYEILQKAYRSIPQPEEDEQELLERMDADMRAVVEQFGQVHQEIADDEPVMEKLLAVGRKRKSAGDGSFDFIQAFMLARLAAAGDLIDGAAEFYQTAMDMQNNPAPALIREFGLMLSDADRHGQASEVYTKALEHPSPRLQSPGVRSFFLYLNSHALEMDGQTEKALTAIREARDLQPDNAGYHFQEAWIHYHTNQWDKAIAEYEDLIQTYDSSTDEQTQDQVKRSRYTLSAIYVQQGDEVKGEEILLEIYRADPEDTQVNNDLGYLWADQGRKLDQAKAMIEKALAAEPENAAYLDSLGWVLYKLGDYKASREQLEKASSLPNGQDSTIYDHLGDAYEKLGQQDKAVQAWQKALELEQAESHPDQRILDRVKSKLPD